MIAMFAGIINMGKDVWPHVHQDSKFYITNVFIYLHTHIFFRNFSLLDQDRLECVTKEQCLTAMKLTEENHCTKNCSYQYKANESSHCVKCKTDCTPEYCTLEDPLVQFISDIEHLQGCRYLNSSLILKFFGEVDIKTIGKYLGSLERIEGYLKIYRSQYFESLYFFKNLQIISGSSKEYDQYSLVIYENRNLKDLWEIKTLKIESGGIYIEKNPKLCNNVIHNFAKAIEHTKEFDHFQRNDREVLCHPIKFDLAVHVSF